MEQSAGRALFERHARGVRLTEAGTVVARRADSVLAELEATRQDLEDLDAQPPRRLRVGAFATALGAVVPRALAVFLSQRRETRVLLREGTSDRLLARVADGRLDLAIVTPPSTPIADVELITLLEDPLLVAVGRGHRLAGRSSVAADELRDERWIAGSADPDSPLLGAWTASAWKPDVAYVARGWIAKLGLVAADLGVTVVPGLALPSLPDTVAVARIDHHEAIRTTAIAGRIDDRGDPGRDAFTETLHDSAAALGTEVRRRVRK